MCHSEGECIFVTSKTVSAFQGINVYYLWMLFLCHMFLSDPYHCQYVSKIHSLSSRNVHSCQYIFTYSKSTHLCPNHLFWMKEKQQNIEGKSQVSKTEHCLFSLHASDFVQPKCEMIAISNYFRPRKCKGAEHRELSISYFLSTLTYGIFANF